jgi:hypothetical protein
VHPHTRERAGRRRELERLTEKASRPLARDDRDPRGIRFTEQMNIRTLNILSVLKKGSWQGPSSRKALPCAGLTV